MSSWLHLARRFFGSLVPGGPKAADEVWARSSLLPAEGELWRQMSGPDRRHAVGVARRTVEMLADRADRPVVAAALLHDVGKIDVGFGPFRRTGATLIARATGYEKTRRWRHAGGPKGSVGRYLCHDEIGSELLAKAGSDDLTVTWAREHHLPPERWTVSPEVGAALKAADDD